VSKLARSSEEGLAFEVADQEIDAPVMIATQMDDTGFSASSDVVLAPKLTRR
jgi:hypothetical protein